MGGAMRLRQYQPTITEAASSDLKEIFDYIVKDSPQSATATIERILKAVEGLEILPYRYKLHQRSRNPDQRVRSMPIPPFVVYYRVIEGKRNRTDSIDTARRSQKAGSIR